MENLETNKVYVFPCGQWLSLDEEGDGMTFRELYPMGKKVRFSDQGKKVGKKGMQHHVTMRTGQVFSLILAKFTLRPD